MEQHQILYSLRSIFQDLPGYTESTYPSSTSLLNHDIFGKYFEMSVSPTSKQVPVFNCISFISFMRNAGDVFPCRVIIPLSVGNTVSRRGSYDIIIRNCFERYCNLGVLKCDTTKGTYYGAPGILLDKDFNPLFIAFYDIERNSIPTRCWKITGITIKISPKVFLNTDKLLEKSLVNKIIPMYLSGPINVNTFNTSITGGTFFPKIVVEDISEFVKAPVVPHSDEHTNEELNDFLASRIDTDIISFEC